MVAVRFAVVVLAVVVGCYSQTSTTGTPVTTDEPNLFCGRLNGTTCDRCIQARQPGPNNVSASFCFWCAATMSCQHFDENTVFPFNRLPCPNLEYNVGTCALTALIIAVLIALALVLVVVMLICVCCCCCIFCAQRRKRLRMVEENRYMEEKDSIRQKSSERRQERKAKHDEIRRKYGLYNEEQDGHYKRLES